MFVGKAKSLPKTKHMKVASLGRLWSYFTLSSKCISVLQENLIIRPQISKDIVILVFQQLFSICILVDKKPFKEQA